MRFPVSRAQVKRNTGYRNSNRRQFYRDVYLRSEHWKQLREAKLAKVCKCQKCGVKHCLDVHHLRYKGLYDVTEKDLQVLCRICHGKVHNNLIPKFKRKQQRKITLSFPILVWLMNKLILELRRIERGRTGKRKTKINLLTFGKSSQMYARSKIYNEQFKIMQH